MEQEVVTGIAFSRDEAQITLRGVADKPGVAAAIFMPLAEANINVDMIIQVVSDDTTTTDITLTVPAAEFARAMTILEERRAKIGYAKLHGAEDVVKISAIGVGMRSHSGVAARAQEGHQHFGTVTFANSCGPAVQPAFIRGVALLHSFEFGPAIDAFKAAHDADPGCTIALWGIGLAQWGNPFGSGGRPPAQLQAGRSTVQRAIADGAKTERERDYIAALGALYADFETVDQRTRMLAYRDAMDRVAAKYPDDTEAAAFYALSLAAAAERDERLAQLFDELTGQQRCGERGLGNVAGARQLLL